MTVRDVLFVASRGMAPPWHGRTKPLTERELTILAAAVVDPDGHVTWKLAYSMMGESRALSALASLGKAGGMRRVRYGVYEITEKGRIAYALATSHRRNLCSKPS